MNLYIYRATVVDVYDGDTMTVNIDLGFSIVLRNIKLRLVGIDTPELRGGTTETKSFAKEARDFVRDKCLGKQVYIRSFGKGKFGRWLATVWLVENNEKSEKSINDLLLESGLAKPYLK
ncbi:MAG: thermonuclease family protein [Candidatus Kariarchaeaceae archaeon]|jgi:micrococcal nuclease